MNSIITQIISISFSVVALIISIYNLILQRKSFQISQDDYNGKKADIRLTLLQSKFTTQLDNNFYAYKLIISNGSDSNNAIVNCSLKVNYKIDHDNLGILSLMHDNDILRILTSTEYNSFQLPQKIEAHDACMGWVFFKANSDFINSKEISKYIIQIQDSGGELFTLDTGLLQEVIFIES